MNPKQINFSRSFLVCCIYSLIGRLSELEWVCCGVRNENLHVDWAVYSVLSELSLPLVTGGALQLARVFDSFGRSGKVSAVCVRLFFGWMCDFWVVAGELASSPFRPGVCECVCVCVCVYRSNRTKTRIKSIVDIDMTFRLLSLIASYTRGSR